MKADPSIYQFLKRSKEEKKKLLAVLIDPDKLSSSEIPGIINQIEKATADIILFGGSLLIKDIFETTIKEIKALTKLPVIIFPGNASQVSSYADGILLLSLISGRNPELLIGQHVIAAPALKKSGIEIIPTGYMLIESGKQTTASYISNTLPIPSDKAEIATCTALAGEQLGLKIIYLDGGSGAQNPVNAKMISAVKKAVSLPVIVGGGIKTAEQAHTAINAGADMIVIGTAFEKDETILKDIADAVKSFSDTLEIHQLPL